MAYSSDALCLAGESFRFRTRGQHVPCCFRHIQAIPDDLQVFNADFHV